MGLLFMGGQAVSSLSIVPVIQHYRVSFVTNPSNCGMLSEEATNIGYSGNVTVPACWYNVSSGKEVYGEARVIVGVSVTRAGYGWSYWSATGNITFDNKFADPTTATIKGNGTITANLEYGVSTPISALLPINPLSILLAVIFFPHFILESMMIIIGNKYDIAVFPTYEFVLDTTFILVSLFFLYEWRKMQ